MNDARSGSKLRVAYGRAVPRFLSVHDGIRTSRCSFAQNKRESFFVPIQWTIAPAIQEKCPEERSRTATSILFAKRQAQLKFALLLAYGRNEPHNGALVRSFPSTGSTLSVVLRLLNSVSLRLFDNLRYSQTSSVLLAQHTHGTPPPLRNPGSMTLIQKLEISVSQTQSSPPRVGQPTTIQKKTI